MSNAAKRERTAGPPLDTSVRQDSAHTQVNALDLRHPGLHAVSDRSTSRLSPGSQKRLVKEIIDQFCPRVVPNSVLLYVAHANEELALFDEASLRAAGVGVGPHENMPDVVVHDTARDWLLLIDAVASDSRHGPVDPKRRGELSMLFKGARPGLVFVTAFLTRRAMTKYLPDISWKTEVWIAESPDHMIHFDGERFLGPHGTP